MTTALALCLALAAPQAGDPGVLPGDKFLGGWSRLAPLQVWNPATLYGFIDGGADLFLEFGFEAVTVQGYRNGEDEFSVEIYRMSDPLAALGIYLAKCGEETPDPTLALRHTLGRYQLVFVKDRYYGIINNESGRAAWVRDLVAFARHLSSRIPDQAGPDPFTLLPAAGRKPGSERLIRGPLALQALFTLGPGDILSLRGRWTAAAAVYGEATRIMADYGEEAVADAAFRHLAGNLDPYLKPLERGASRLVFEDFTHRFGRIERAGARLSIELGLASRPAPAKENEP